MKGKRVILMTMVIVMLAMFSVHVNAAPVLVLFDVGYLDPGNSQGDPQRSPVLVPTVEIEDSTLFFSTPCDGCLLRVVSEGDEVVYSTIIPTGADTLVLPSSLSGDYELQIISGNYVFYGLISL